MLPVCLDDLKQDCSIFSALAMEILQSCTKPLIPCGHVGQETQSCHYGNTNFVEDFSPEVYLGDIHFVYIWTYVRGHFVLRIF